jgi:LCP family protein required for cell wall assembly
MSNKSKPKMKPIFRLLLIIAAVIFSATLCVTGYTYIRLSSIKSDDVEVTIKPTPIAHVTPAPAPSLEPVQGVPDDIDVDVDDNIDPAQVEMDPIYSLDNIDEKVINILFIGEDTRPGEAGAGRSDTMMLLSYDCETNEAKLISFLRDTYVYIPGRDTWNRINTAYRFGGIGLAINTINENFDLDIQYYVSTDFSNLQKIVDTLGGLELSITKKEAAFINVYTQSSSLPEVDGTYLLDGEQVLAHCRNRKTGDGDWGRTNRQRQVMLAFFNRAKKERNVDTLAVLANSLLQYVHTNMDPNLLIQLCVDAVLSDQFSLKSGAVPFEDTWKYARVNGASVIQINIEENKVLLNAFLYGEN